MSLMKMRKSVQKDNWLTKKYRQKPSRWLAVVLSAVTVVFADLFFGSGSSRQAMALGGCALVFALLVSKRSKLRFAASCMTVWT